MSSPAPRLMTVSEFAAAIGKSKRQVFRYVTQGRLATVTLDDMSRQSVRIPDSELERFFNAIVTPDDMRVTDEDDALRHDVTERHKAGPTQPAVPLERYEAAVLRMGWLQSELESTRRALTDGGSRENALMAQIHTESEARRQAELRAAVIDEVRRRAETAEQREQEARKELEAARERVRQLELAQERLKEVEAAQAQLPWWKKVFGVKPKA